MKRLHGGKYSSRAFTLIELLVVISIIAVLAAGVGLALRNNNPDASLRSAQGAALGALSSARGQAALTQVNARILVQADSAKDDFLRTLRIVIQDTATSGNNWKQVGTDIILPEGVYVVPPSTPSSVTLGTENGLWNDGRNSTLFNSAATTVGGVTGSWFVSKDISSLGTVDGGRIVVTPGRKTSPTTLVLFNASAVRGLEVSRYGVASVINDPESFD